MPVAAAAAVEPVAAAVRAVTPGEPVLLTGEVMAGELEALLLLGLLLLALSRPVARVPGAGAVRRTLHVTGLVALGLVAVTALVTAAVLPWDVGDLTSLQRAAVKVVRVTAAGVVGLLLSLVPGRRSRAARTVSSAVGGAVLLGTGGHAGRRHPGAAGRRPRPRGGPAGGPRASGRGEGAGPARRPGRGGRRRGRGRGGRARRPRRGCSWLSVDASARGEGWTRPARGVPSSAVAVCRWRRSVVAPALSPAPRPVASVVRDRLVPAVVAAGATVVLWQGVLLLPGPWPRAAAALGSLVPVAAAAVLARPAPARDGAVARGPVPARGRGRPPSPLQLVLGALVVLVADETLRAEGRLSGLHLVVAGLAAAVLGRRRHPGRRRATTALARLAVGRAPVAAGAPLAEGPRGRGRALVRWWWPGRAVACRHRAAGRPVRSAGPHPSRTGRWPSSP